jgi:hypothetical protein
LEDDLQLSSSQCATEQLIAIPISFIPMNLEVGKEALNRFIERYSVFGEFIVFKVVFEIRRSKPIPIDHGSLYRAGKAFRTRLFSGRLQRRVGPQFVPGRIVLLLSKPVWIDGALKDLCKIRSIALRCQSTTKRFRSLRHWRALAPVVRTPVPR